MKNFLQTSKLHAILWILGAVILLLIAFGLGMFVGSRGAAFRAHFDENYFSNFYGAPIPQGFGGAAGGRAFIVQGPPNAHGTIGKVIDKASSTLSVVDADGDEVSVSVPTSTVIQQGGAAITLGAIRLGDMVAVIGAPNGEGQIAARFIRVLRAPAPSSTTSTPANL